MYLIPSKTNSEFVDFTDGSVRKILKINHLQQLYPDIYDFQDYCVNGY